MIFFICFAFSFLCTSFKDALSFKEFNSSCGGGGGGGDGGDGGGGVGGGAGGGVGGGDGGGKQWLI